MLRAPQSSLLTENSLALFLDYYQLTMGQADFKRNNNTICTENYFIRRIPQGKYLIVAGLEQVIHYILNLKFTDDDLSWLKNTAPGMKLETDFVDYLRNFKFDGDIYALPEGSLAFASEPIINITGKSIDVQIFETYLLTIMNFQTLIATKSSRIVHSAKGRSCFDFGARRAHGRDAAILAARASFIGGIKSTSLVIAARNFDIPYVGTMAHKFVQDSSSEVQAFRDYAQTFPDNTILLVDTYDTLQGTRNAIQIAKEMEQRGQEIHGIRLDSGDLISLSKSVREILDQSGFQKIKILASNDLDEFQIDKILEANAPIDGFGIGTRLATGSVFNSITGEGGVSSMPGVYKHVEREENGINIPTFKLSEDPGKSTLAGKKQILRIFNKSQYTKDQICLWQEVEDGEGLMIPIVKKGELVYDFPSVTQIQRHTREELSKLPKRYKNLSHESKNLDDDNYPIEISPQLLALQNKLIKEKMKS
ncbi:nicotinate phosphoribosyltransferase [Candidatus Poribacteria bacterium]|nr:nicotinate phosphoribosyltransferase [Candidatus Poribacteria bacterium]OUT67394.1 MAG: nicotinate phosphoribosyltransferase [bacterium TMED15]